MSEDIVDYLEAAARDLPLEQFIIAMRRKLAGLAIVPAADVLSAEDRAVLDGLRELCQQAFTDSDVRLVPGWEQRWRELARRAAKQTAAELTSLSGEDLHTL